MTNKIISVAVESLTNSQCISSNLPLIEDIKSMSIPIIISIIALGALCISWFQWRFNKRRYQAEKIAKIKTKIGLTIIEYENYKKDVENPPLGISQKTLEKNEEAVMLLQKTIDKLEEFYDNLGVQKATKDPMYLETGVAMADRILNVIKRDHYKFIENNKKIKGRKQ